MQRAVAARECRKIYRVGGRAEADALIGAGSLPPNIAKLGEAAEVAITFLVLPLA